MWEIMGKVPIHTSLLLFSKGQKAFMPGAPKLST